MRQRAGLTRPLCQSCRGRRCKPRRDSCCTSRGAPSDQAQRESARVLDRRPRSLLPASALTRRIRCRWPQENALVGCWLGSSCFCPPPSMHSSRTLTVEVSGVGPQSGGAISASHLGEQCWCEKYTPPRRMKATQAPDTGSVTRKDELVIG